jgi:hypothetical protein
MPVRRLEDRIRELCAKACAYEDAELGPILEKLKAVLQEHTKREMKSPSAKLPRKRK